MVFISFAEIDLHLHYMNIKGNEVYKIVNNSVEKHVHS